MHLFPILFLSLILVVSGFADPKEYYFRRFSASLNSSRNSIERRELQPQFFDQKVNPFDPSDERTFKQRYYFDDRFASGPGAPVFFYLCGEATCRPGALKGAVEEHAKAHSAYLFALEHRYYGESQPFPLLTTQNLAQLTTTNALKDASLFQTYIQTKLGLKGKWIVIGGSYPGSLAAYYRLSYPTLVAGALASSGPVQARENFEDYDLHVSTVAGPVCAGAMKKVVAQVESALSNPELILQIKQKFQAEVLKDDDDFLYLVADMGALAIQYGYRDVFCNLLQNGDPLEGYAKFTRDIFKDWKMNALSDSVQGAVSLDPKDYLDNFGLRQWFYQSCTEYGYWQNAYHDASKSVRSARINPAYHRKLCQRLFDIDQPVEPSKINESLYLPLLNAPTSAILFTNGSRDPWSLLSISHENGNATNPQTTAVTIDGAAHCDDLRPYKPTDSDGLKQARKLFSDLVDVWVE